MRKDGVKSDFGFIQSAGSSRVEALNQLLHTPYCNPHPPTLTTLWRAAQQATVHRILQARTLEWVAISFSNPDPHHSRPNTKNCSAYCLVMKWHFLLRAATFTMGNEHPCHCLKRNKPICVHQQDVCGFLWHSWNIQKSTYGTLTVNVEGWNVSKRTTNKDLLCSTGNRSVSLAACMEGWSLRGFGCMHYGWDPSLFTGNYYNCYSATPQHKMVLVLQLKLKRRNNQLICVYQQNVWGFLLTFWNIRNLVMESSSLNV